VPVQACTQSPSIVDTITVFKTNCNLVTFKWVRPRSPCGRINEYQCRVRGISGAWAVNPRSIGADISSWTVPYSFFMGAPLSLPYGHPIDFQIRALSDGLWGPWSNSQGGCSANRCDSGAIWDDVSSRCISGPIRACPMGQTFSVALGVCYSGPGQCPYGTVSTNGDCMCQ